MTATENKKPDPSLATAVDAAGGATPPGIATGYEGTAADQFRAYIARVRAGQHESGRPRDVPPSTSDPPTAPGEALRKVRA